MFPHIRRRIKKNQFTPWINFFNNKTQIKKIHQSSAWARFQSWKVFLSKGYITLLYILVLPFCIAATNAASAIIITTTKTTIVFLPNSTMSLKPLHFQVTHYYQVTFFFLHIFVLVWWSWSWWITFHSDESWMRPLITSGLFCLRSIWMLML